MFAWLKRTLSSRQLGVVETYHKISGASAVDLGIDKYITDSVDRAGQGEYTLNFKVLGQQDIAPADLVAITPNVLIQCVDSTEDSIDIEARTTLAIAAVAASKIIEDLTYLADTAGDAGNDITVEYEEGSSKSSLIVQDITYEAVDSGVGGDAIEIKYVDTVTQGNELATVVGTVITVAIESGVSTATQVRAAILASAAALLLVTATISGTASDPQVTAAQTPLANGGDIIVGVVGSVITVGIEQGVHTATNIKTAVDASVAASALLSVSVSGTGGDIQSLQGPTNLAGGVDAYSEGDLIDADFYLSCIHSLRLRTNS